MYCEDPTVLPAEPPYCDVPTRLGALLLYCDCDCDSAPGNWMVGAWGPERAAREAFREPEPALAMLDWRRWLSCCVYSGPRYCDRRTVLRFS
jgi:hypothetical protein